MVAKAKVADRILVLQTKDHLFDCPAQFHSPQTKTVIKQYWEQMLDFSTTTIEFKSHSHFDLYSNQVLETQKRCRSPDARARFSQLAHKKYECTFVLVESTVNLIRHF